jgi:hypothetical protein
MNKDADIQATLAVHARWCRKERDRLAEELRCRETVGLSFGKRRIGERSTQAAGTDLEHLRLTIEQLNRVISVVAASNR